MADYRLLALYEVNADKAIKETEGFEDALENTGKTAKQTGEQFASFGADLANIGVGLAAAGATFKKAFDLAEEGLQIKQTTDSYMGLMQQLDIGAEILDEQRAAVRGTISDYELMSATQTLLAGASKELATDLAQATPELLEIAKAANKLNPALGDTTFLYDSLATGIKRASPLILDNLGLTISIGDANTRYAESLGKTVDELTEEEKKLALLNATLEAGDQLIAQAGGNVDSYTDSFQRLRAELDNTKNDMLKLLGEGLAPLIDGFFDLRDAVAEQDVEVAHANETYDEYMQRMMRVHGAMDVLQGLVEVMTEDQFRVAQGVDAATRSFDVQAAAANNLRGSLLSIPTAITTTITTNRVGGQNVILPRNQPGFQQGGNMIVPPQFVNDGLLIRVSAGEEVNVTSRQDRQRGQRDGNHGGGDLAGLFAGATFQINNGMDMEQFGAMVNDYIGQ